MEFLPLKKKSKNSEKVDKKRVKAIKTEKLKKTSKKKISKKEKKDAKTFSDKVKKVKRKEESKESKEVKFLNQNEKIDYRKNRLFVFMKKKIVNEAIVKELHPDIISVRFPRKKRSRWCWAIFESEKKAHTALKKLKSRADVIVREPFTKEKGESLSKKKLVEIRSKKEMKKMLRQSWI